jgi:hypothetical protein
MVSWSTTDVLRFLRDDIPTSFASTSRSSALGRLATVLDRDAASYYCEFRFDDDPQVDFLALLRDRRTAAQRFHQAVAGGKDEAWRRTLVFLDAWSTDAICGQVPFVWLEFDGVHAPGAGLPSPNPAFGVEPGYWGRHIRAPTPPEPRRARAIVQHGLSLLTTTTKQAALKCTDALQSALPSGGSLICVTVMLARNPEVTKLYVSVPRLELCALLERIGWPGDIPAVREFHNERFGHLENDMFIDLSVGEDGFESTLGFAWSQFQQGIPHHLDSSWAQLLGAQACPAKLDLARSWFGVRETRIEGLRTWVHRWLDLKAVMRSNQTPIQLKGYLGFMPSMPLPFS